VENTERVGVGIVGAGQIARDRHVPGFRRLPGVELVAVANRGLESSRRAAEEFGFARAHRHWRDLLTDPDVDAVVIGAALHWFDRPAADREIARVLRSGGVVGVLANKRDTRPAWASALDDLLNEEFSDLARSPRSTDQATFDPELFTPPAYVEFPYSQSVDAEGLAEVVASRSYVIDMDDKERAALMAAVRDLARTHPDLAGRETFEVPYLTVAVRSFRR